MNRITRSPGTIVHVGQVPFVVGSGYRGLTEELDATVQQAAELLATAFDWEVQIRFNADRRSGGAWLVTPQRGDFWRNGEVGLGAQLVPVMDGGYDPERWLEMTRADRDALLCEIVIDTNVDARVTGVDATPEVEPAGGLTARKLRAGHATLQEAVAYLVHLVDQGKLGTTQPESGVWGS